LVAGTFEHWTKTFHRVGWCIPPYIPMGALSRASQVIMERGDKFNQNDLEKILEEFYDEDFLARMVTSVYPIAPAIKEYKAIIGESVEAHCLGLDHIAASGFTPVVEGAGRQQLATQRGLKQTPSKNVHNVLMALADDCEQESITKTLGAVGEVVSMMQSFTLFVKNYLYVGAGNYSLSDKTNRHGITHGYYTDADYGTPLNFYKTITAINFLTFISSFKINMSLLGPSPTEASSKRALYYNQVKRLGAMRP